MAIRARGANAKLAFAFNSAAYGAVPGSGYAFLPFASEALGDEQGLIESDLLGQGREPQAPTDDVINNQGDIVVPVDLRNFGKWLKLLFGAPTTTQGVAATGSIVFATNPAANDTVTIGGTAVTFKTSGATGNQVNIGATLADSLTALLLFLHDSADANLVQATYGADDALTTLQITFGTLGTSGNSFTIAALAATPSGATLAGGSATGPYNHVFTSGAAALPDAAVEVGMTDVSKFFMNYGVMADALKIQLQRSGLLNATVSLVAQGEQAPTGSTQAGSPATLATLRFSQFSGRLLRSGVPLAQVQTGAFSYMNNLDKDESIRSDGRIGGADAGQITVGMDLSVKFGSTPLYDLGVSKAPIDLAFGWQLSSTQRLDFRVHQFRLPKSKLPVSGPNGVLASFKGIGFKDPTLGRSVTVTLVNDVASY